MAGYHGQIMKPGGASGVFNFTDLELQPDTLGPLSFINGLNIRKYARLAVLGENGGGKFATCSGSTRRLAELFSSSSAPLPGHPSLSLLFNASWPVTV